MPASPAKRWTAAEARQLNQEGVPTRYEVVDGELLVTPSPRPAHQFVVSRLALALGNYLNGQRIGECLTGPADIELEPDSTLGPDIFVVPSGGRIASWSDVTSLLLVVEVLSPSSVVHDREAKRKYFMRNGVPVYWIVDIDAAAVEEWRPGQEHPRIITDRLAWIPNGATMPFSIDLFEFFTGFETG